MSDDGTTTSTTEMATFGAGCFWQVEAAFRELDGVIDTAVGYEDLVSKYLELHDPTQLNRQGPDVGWQYRSVVFAHSDEQAETARRIIEAAADRYQDPIVTEVEPAEPFWRAEEYHQCYLEKRSEGSGLLGTLLGR